MNKQLEKYLIDWMHNGFEHSQDTIQDAYEMVSFVDDISSEEKTDYTVKVAALMEAWMNNEDNIRMSISLNFRDIQLNNDKVLDFIRKYCH